MVNNTNNEESLLSGLGTLVKLLFFLIVSIYCTILFITDLITVDKYAVSGLMFLMLSTRYLAISVAVAHDFYRFPTLADLFWNSNLTQSTSIKVKMWTGIIVIPMLYLLNRMYHNPEVYHTDLTNQMNKFAWIVGGFLIIYYSFLKYIYTQSVVIPKYLKDNHIAITDLTASDISNLKREQLQQIPYLDFSTTYKKIMSSMLLIGIFLYIIKKLFIKIQTI